LKKSKALEITEKGIFFLISKPCHFFALTYFTPFVNGDKYVLALN